MTRIRFQRNLDDLKEKLLVMAGMAEQSIQRAIEAYRTRDLSICDLVDRGELAINHFEREIDQMALEEKSQYFSGSGNERRTASKDSDEPICPLNRMR